MSNYISEAKVSCDASLCQGIVTGIFYGTVFGFSSKLFFRKDKIFKIRKYSGRIVLSNMAHGIAAFTAFSTIFNVTSCQLGRVFPDDELRPFIKGISGFLSSFSLAYYESRCVRSASRPSAVVGLVMTAAHMYPIVAAKAGL